MKQFCYASMNLWYTGNRSACLLLQVVNHVDSLIFLWYLIDFPFSEWYS